MRRLFLIGLGVLLVSAPIFADEETSPAEEPAGAAPANEYRPITLGAYVGANILSSFIGNGGTTTNRIGFDGGLDLQAYFVEQVGVFVGGHFVTRGFRLVSTETSSASFLDVPFGLAFRRTSALFKDSAEDTLLIGGYVSLPLSDFKTPTLTSHTASTSFGLNLGAKTLFKVSGNFSLGFGTWVRFGLTKSMTTGTADKLLEIGIGLAAGF